MPSPGSPSFFGFFGFWFGTGLPAPPPARVGGNWRHTERNRREVKLQQRKQALRARMHEPAAQVGEWLTRVLRGYYNYRGVPENRASLNRFREWLMGYRWHAVTGRSQSRVFPDPGGPKTRQNCRTSMSAVSNSNSRRLSIRGTAGSSIGDSYGAESVCWSPESPPARMMLTLE